MELTSSPCHETAIHGSDPFSNPLKICLWVPRSLALEEVIVIAIAIVCSIPSSGARSLIRMLGR